MSPAGPVRRMGLVRTLGCRTRRLLLLLVWATASPAAAQPVVVDLSDRLIAITTAFTGTDVLLFGGIREPGGAIAVLVFGPEEEVRVRHKSRVGPFWLNTDEVRFRGVPSFYAVATSVPIEALAPPDLRARLQIGIENLRFEAVHTGGRRPEEIARFAEALRRNKRREGLYVARPLGVRMVEDLLFRTTISFPARVRPGSYEVRTLYFRDGRLEHAQSSILVITKVGLEAELFDFANRRPLLYGLGSVLAAMFAGWTANILFATR